MQTRFAAIDERFSTNTSMPFMLALGFHVGLVVLNPTILKASPYVMSTPVINVRMMDHLPVMEVPKPLPPKPVEKKKIERKIVHKAKKSGLSMSTKPTPMAITPRKIMPKQVAAPKPFVSKITMPKFVPHENDEPIAASPIPGSAPAARVRAVNAFKAPSALVGKSRGVRAQDIPFELSDRGTSIAAGAAVVAIPVGEERGEIASLPHAPTIPGAARGKKGIAGYRFSPGQGSGSGELMGHDKGNGRIGYHGAVVADAYVEGSLNGVGGNGKGGKVVTGKGFEIGGPVGDRHITHRRLPEYPAWAEEKGISAMVKIYFTVRPDGSLRTSMRILTSSGYAELDDLAKEALAQWKFSATSADSSESTAWGVITFRFTLA